MTRLLVGTVALALAHRIDDARSVVELHGGALELVASAAGSVFRMRLPGGQPPP